MSEIERDGLENAFRLWKQARTPASRDDDAFEIFSIEQILKDADLSDAEIKSGNFGGPGDGGVDGFYFFINRALVREDDFQTQSAMNAELVLIQSTLSPGFTEDKIHKLDSFCRNLLDWKPLDGKEYLSQEVKDGMMRFRDTYTKLISLSHTLKINLHFASRSDHPPSTNLLIRVKELIAYIKERLSIAEVEFVPWGCAKLLQAVRSNPQTKLVLKKVKDLSMPDKSIVCLSTVANFASFLDDGHGHLRTWLMEPNVRDYLGNNPVNKQIRGTLNSATWTEDFWWLNNGVTILSDGCSITGDMVTIDNPEIVNGLQTSHEIFNSRHNSSLTERHVLVKVIVAPEDRAKNAIIKATNSQTTVSLVSLKATEPIQFDIEDKLLRIGLFYDRRKGKYKRLKKPIEKIVSIKEMGQAIIAAYLQRPSDARGRPETLLNNEKISPTIFNEDHGLDFFAACILIDRQCADYVGGSQELNPDDKVDLRFYVTMLAAIEITGKCEPSAKEIAATLSVVSSPLGNTMLGVCFEAAFKAYKALGASDQVAKGQDMQEMLRKGASERFPSA